MPSAVRKIVISPSMKNQSHMRMHTSRGSCLENNDHDLQPNNNERQTLRVIKEQRGRLGSPVHKIHVRGDSVPRKVRMEGRNVVAQLGIEEGDPLPDGLLGAHKKLLQACNA